jgi:hypothetical protein
MFRSRLLGHLVGSVLLSIVARALPCSFSCLQVIPLSLSLFQKCWRWLPVGGPDSRWLDCVLGSASSLRCQWRTSPLGRGVCPCNHREMLPRKLSFVNCFCYSVFWIQNLSCNNLNYHFTLSILNACLCVFAHSHFNENPVVDLVETNPSFLRWFCNTFQWNQTTKHFYSCHSKYKFVRI